MNIACTLVGVCEEVVVVGRLRLGAYEIRAAVHNSSNEELSAICLVEKMAAIYLRQATVQNNQKILTLMTIGSRGTTAEVDSWREHVQILLVNKSESVRRQNESAKEKTAMSDFVHARGGNKVKTVNQGRDRAAPFQISHDVAYSPRE
jgi:hypothetical protein